MRTERLQSCWKPILILYAASFVLPVGTPGVPGVVIFIFSLSMGFFVPFYLFLWLANPLFWIGLAALRRGRWDRSVAFGAASLLASSPSLKMILPHVIERLRSDDWAAVPLTSGYFAWLASFTLLVMVGGLAWWSDAGRPRAQFRLGWLMIAIALIAVLFALWPRIDKAMYWAPFSGAIGAPG